LRSYTGAVLGIAIDNVIWSAFMKSPESTPQKRAWVARAFTVVEDIFVFVAA